MNVDYIVVGSGLAGILFSHELIKADKSFVMISDNSQKSSVVAGGLYNPVVLKRFTEVWKAQEQIDLVNQEYKALEQLLKVTLGYKISVYRLFASIEEQNNWFQACDKPALRSFLDSEILHEKYNCINSPFGFGQVKQTGRIDTLTLIEAFRKRLEASNQFLEEPFIHEQIILGESKVKYKGIRAKHIVFAEGFGIKKNPLFNKLPLNGTKGELLTIHAPNLKIDFVLKSAVFLIPLGNALYRVGATYEWTDKTNTITENAKQELVNKLKSILKCEFTIVDQVAGIRPTVKDRRPLVGAHKKHKNVYVLNGLGTRGVMIAPYVAKQLFNKIENKLELSQEIDIKRFN